MYRDMKIVSLLYFTVATNYIAYGLPSGAPQEACVTLTPQHPGTTPRECPPESCPFALFLSEIDNDEVSPDTGYRCGANHTRKPIILTSFSL